MEAHIGKCCNHNEGKLDHSCNLLPNGRDCQQLWCQHCMGHQGWMKVGKCHGTWMGSDCGKWKVLGLVERDEYRAKVELCSGFYNVVNGAYKNHGSWWQTGVMWLVMMSRWLGMFLVMCSDWVGKGKTDQIDIKPSDGHMGAPVGGVGWNIHQEQGELQ